MLCESCGKEIADKSLFCPYCNEQVSARCQSVKIPTEEVEVFVDEIDEELSRRMKLLPLYITVIVLGVAAIVTGLIVALKMAILGDLSGAWAIRWFVSLPGSILTAGGILALVLICSRKQATRSAQRKKKALDKVCCDKHCNCK